MKVTNNSKVRAYHVRNVMIAPGDTKEFADDVSADIKGIDDLSGSGKAKQTAQDVEFKDVPSAPMVDADEVDTSGMKKVELQALLDEAGIEYPSNANKAELQALVDGIQ